ncbi:MAG: protein kinase, partial [Clostridia bacterium]|nr:protein kinase [Clostridia bacterium]
RGETLKSFLDRNRGRIYPNSALAMMRPLMESLIEVHRHGIIHRDISPDNIMITRDSKVKLLDFGAARDISIGGNKSLSIQLKPGYAPEEQYRTHGNQGPWTDVYALCATIYRAITGIPPIEALERLQHDSLKAPSALGVNIDPNAESAIMRGLAVFANVRTQTVSALYDQLYSPYVNRPYVAPPVPPRFVNQAPANKRGITRTVVVISSIIGVLAIALVSFAVGHLYFTPKTRNTFYSGSSGKKPERIIDELKVTEEPKVTEKVYASPVFNHISASSTRGTDYTSGVAVNYYPEYAFDGDYTTAWSSDRHIELTPTIILSAETKQHVSGVRMSNGYFKNENTYVRNRRITKVRVEYEGGGVTQKMDINMYRIMQDIEFEKPVDTSYIKIQVLESYYGDWKDIAISEIEVY